MADILEPGELGATTLFAGASARALRLVAEHGHVETYRKGAVIFEVGDPPGAMYLVRRGRVEVLMPNVQDVINDIGPGEIVGELAVILGEPRSATLRAKTAVTLWALPRESFAAVLAVHPELAVLLAQEVSRRLVTTTQRVAPQRDTIITAVWGTAAPVAAAIAAADPTAKVGVGDLPGGVVGKVGSRRIAKVDTGDGSETVVRSWFTGRVSELDHLVVAAGPMPVAANRALLSSAGNVVMVDPEPPWLAKLDPAGRVIRGGGSNDDLQRIGRVIAGRSVGLVLSSGGSKTVAHIGTIAALREHGHPVDSVSGSSGGSLFAAGFAFGHSADVITTHTRAFAGLSTLRRLDYSKLPRSGLIRGVRIHEQLRRWFDGARIEDATIPLTIVAADVETGDEVLLERGDLADALRASMSIPGAFEPWSVEGRWLIDGAIVDPLPAAPLRAGGAGVIVASNVAGQENLRQTTGDKTPGILQVMGRAVNASERELLRGLEGLVDVMIRPIVKASGPLDFSRIDEFIAAGLTTAREVLATQPLAGNRRPRTGR